MLEGIADDGVDIAAGRFSFVFYETRKQEGHGIQTVLKAAYNHDSRGLKLKPATTIQLKEGVGLPTKKSLWNKEAMRSSFCIVLLSLLRTAPSCYAYDITQPPKQTPTPLPDVPAKKQKKAETVILTSTMCSGAVGAIIGSALAPQNLARQWLAVSTAGTVLLISAGVEGEWIGRFRQWWKRKNQAVPKQWRQKVNKEVLEYISESSSENEYRSPASEVEIEEMGRVKPIRQETKRDTQVSFESSNNGRAESSTSSSFSSGESSASSGETQTIKVSDRAQQAKVPDRKKSHRNLLMFWKRKKKQQEDTDVKPTIPAWSEFASEDTSRGYQEDYGDDDIGEGLGL